MSSMESWKIWLTARVETRSTMDQSPAGFGELCPSHSSCTRQQFDKVKGGQESSLGTGSSAQCPCVPSLNPIQTTQQQESDKWEWKDAFSTAATCCTVFPIAAYTGSSLTCVTLNNGWFQHNTFITSHHHDGGSGFIWGPDSPNPLTRNCQWDSYAQQPHWCGSGPASTQFHQSLQQEEKEFEIGTASTTSKRTWIWSWKTLWCMDQRHLQSMHSVIDMQSAFTDAEESRARS